MQDELSHVRAVGPLAGVRVSGLLLHPSRTTTRSRALPELHHVTITAVLAQVAHGHGEGAAGADARGRGRGRGRGAARHARGMAAVDAVVVAEVVRAVLRCAPGEVLCGPLRQGSARVAIGPQQRGLRRRDEGGRERTHVAARVRFHPPPLHPQAAKGNGGLLSQASGRRHPGGGGEEHDEQVVEETLF